MPSRPSPHVPSPESDPWGMLNKPLFILAVVLFLLALILGPVLDTASAKVVLGLELGGMASLAGGFAL